MAFEFLFEPWDSTDRAVLVQGDILRRTDELKAALREAHPYYADADDYTHFMVLTQSCDLAKHGKKKPRARYITLAAIRPARLVVDRLIEKHRFNFDFPLPICAKDRELAVSQMLERLLHNTEPAHFFIRKGSHPNVTLDLCVFVALSVALKIDHYDVCLSSKVAQLSHIFQAKVGWIAGNLYSRIGTPDIEDEETDPDQIKEEFQDEMLRQRSAWFTPAQLRCLKNSVEKWKANNGGLELTEEIAIALIKQVPENIDLIAERIVSTLSESKFIDGDDVDVKQRAVHLLRNDRALKKMVQDA